MNTVAVIDVGSNSVKLLVTQRAPVGMRTLADESEITRLARGLRQTGRLADDAIAKSAETVRRFVQTARALGAEQIVCAGTMALREAKNADAFQSAVRKACGLETRVFSGEEEARLCFEAACETLPEKNGTVAAFDSGGGSTELAAGENGAPRLRASLPVGAVNLTERFFPDGTGECGAARAFVRECLEKDAAHFPTPSAVIGQGGTVTVMAAVMLGLDVFDAGKIRGARLTAGEAERQVALYADLSPARRLALPGMRGGREDIILAGACIVAETLRFLNAPGLIVSDFGLRHGLARRLLAGVCYV